MAQQIDFNMLNLDWISRVVGTHLNIEGIMQEIIAFLKTKIPAKEIILFLWDDVQGKFILEDGTDVQKVYLRTNMKSSILMRAFKLNAPLFIEHSILIPLKTKDKFFGVVFFDGLDSGFDSMKRKEDISLLVKIVEVVLSNANFFIEYENLNKDLFKFNVLSRALNPTMDEEAVVRIFTDGVKRIIKFDIYTLLTLGKHSYGLYIRSKVPLTKANIRAVKKNVTDLILNLTHQPLDTSVLQEKIDIPKGKASKTRIASYLNAPLVTKDKIVGIISLGSFKREEFNTRDHQNISMLASQGAVAFENIMLYKDLQRTYFSIVKALTQAIEAKDPYTRGHSTLVSKYAAAIATKMGLSSSMIESIQIAGLLHDLGKIGVPEEILLKNGKLTDSEFEVVKTHSEIALKILGSVEFPRFSKEQKNFDVLPEFTLSLFEKADLSADIKLMILHHHEKYSGGGYPTGLKKEEIPLGARILAIADTFEALTADRPYRKAYPLAKAKKILRQVSGEQLDASIVKVFLGILNNSLVERLKAEV